MQQRRSHHSHTSRPAHRPHGHTHHPRPQAPAAPLRDITGYVPQGVFVDLIPTIQRAVAEEGYTTPTPIQAQAIPHVLAGKDLMGSAQTGTGKTAAFTLPMLQRLAENRKPPTRGRPRAIILAPTRELCVQIGDSIRTYGRHVGFNFTTVYGGVSQRPQTDALNRGVEIVVATPGRLMDLMEQGFIKLDQIEIFVLDEADRMLDMGFINDIRRIISGLPQHRQSLFFSATLSPEVIQLAKTLLRDPVRISITPEKPTVDRIKQNVMFVDKAKKLDLLIHLLKDPKIDKVIVFTLMKHVAGRVAEKLEAAGITASAIHGNKSQNQRQRALDGFRDGRVRVLVATDVAARGIDVDGISHVINFDLPNEPENYVHRIGRTARAGADGDAISLCSHEDRSYLKDIERLLRTSVPVILDQPFHSESAKNATGAESRPPPRGGHRGGQRGHRGPPKGSGHVRSSHGGHRRG